MDKIAAEIFAPLLANMAGKPLTKAIEQYANVQALQTHTTIRVEKVEITLPRDNTCHPEVYRTGYASDAVLAQAYEMLAERHLQELYDLCCELTEKKA